MEKMIRPLAAENAVIRSLMGQTLDLIPDGFSYFGVLIDYKSKKPCVHPVVGKDRDCLYVAAGKDFKVRRSAVKVGSPEGGGLTELEVCWTEKETEGKQYVQRFPIIYRVFGNPSRLSEFTTESLLSTHQQSGNDGIALIMDWPTADTDQLLGTFVGQMDLKIRQFLREGLERASGKGK